VCFLLSAIAHAAIGRIGRPAFPAPSDEEGKEIESKARANCAARSRGRVWERGLFEIEISRRLLRA
jgi:hypothetical protein